MKRRVVDDILKMVTLHNSSTLVLGKPRMPVARCKVSSQVQKTMGSS